MDVSVHGMDQPAGFSVGLERNSDLVIMESYAPLFVNINPGASQWGTNLIGYDTLQSYGSPSYQVQAMFASHHGNVALPVSLTTGPGSLCSASVTRDSKTGTLYIKVVNASFYQQQVNFTLTGFNSISPNGAGLLLTGNPSATNAPGTPQALPQTTKLTGLGANFSQTFPAYSVTALEIPTK
jgi:alpha-N-arabinofuranosidase